MTMTDRRRFTGKCETKHEIIVAFLWEESPRYVPAHELIKLDRPYGFVGSAGDVRARELARNDCPEKLQNKVERAEGRDIGLDRRFTYFRYKQAMTRGLGTFRERQHSAENGHSSADANETGTVTAPTESNGRAS